MHSPIKNQQAIWNGFMWIFPDGNCPAYVTYLNNYDSVDSHILHGCLRPLEGESVLGEVADALEHAAHVGGGHQLHLRQPHHVGNAWLREPEGKWMSFQSKNWKFNVYCLLGWFKNTIVFIFYMMFYMTFYMMFFMMSSCSSRFSVTKWKITYVTCLRQSQ